MLSVDIGSELETEIAQVAKETGMTLSEFINRAISGYLEEMKDYQLCIESLEEDGTNLTSEELEKELGLAD
ncbi:MAG: hypothetical protein HQL54_04620 [Magnetococcales bacterium]|nr:hypothetical protein [Magnetococcales bacterium]